jgi:hypothetical protein
MSGPKVVVYRYNGLRGTQETIVDEEDEVILPKKDDLIYRKGRPWKVAQVMQELSKDSKTPTIFVFLTDQPN